MNIRFWALWLCRNVLEKGISFLKQKVNFKHSNFYCIGFKLVLQHWGWTDEF